MWQHTFHICCHQTQPCRYKLQQWHHKYQHCQQFPAFHRHRLQRKKMLLLILCHVHRLASLTCAIWEVVITRRTSITLVTFYICFAATKSIIITSIGIAISSLPFTGTGYKGKKMLFIFCHACRLASLTCTSWEVVVTRQTDVTLVTFYRAIL